jgi:hypothetical protein
MAMAIWFMSGAQVTQSVGVGNVPTSWSIIGSGQRGRPDRRQAVKRMDAGQVAEQAEDRNDTGKAAEDGRHEEMPFEAAERERDARERHRQLRPWYHPERSRPIYWHRVPGH